MPTLKTASGLNKPVDIEKFLASLSPEQRAELDQRVIKETKDKIIILHHPKGTERKFGNKVEQLKADQVEVRLPAGKPITRGVQAWLSLLQNVQQIQDFMVAKGLIKGEVETTDETPDAA